MGIRILITGMIGMVCVAMHAQALLYPQHFELSEVRITGGPMRDAMVRNAGLLLDYDADRLMTPFVREARLDSDDGKYSGWLEKHPAFRNWGEPGWSLEGHVGGHYLSALALGYSAMRNDGELSSLAEQLRTRLQHCLDILKDCQDAYAGNREGMEGFLGGQPYTEIWRGLYAGKTEPFRRHYDKVPFYCQHKVLAGLRDAYVYAGSEQARQMYRSLCDWAVTVISNIDDGQLQDILNCEHGGMNEVLADAYHLFGDKRYLDAARRYSHQKMVSGMQYGADGTYDTHFLDRMHANTQVPKYIGFARINSYMSSAVNFFDDVAKHRTVCIGGNSIGEHFLPADKCRQYIENAEGPESCNTNNMMKLAEILFDATHDGRYADFYEAAVWNHILSTQDPETGGFVYFTTLSPQGYRVYSRVNEAMWCCVGTGMENHSKYAHFVYTHSADTLFVNQFMPTILQNKRYALRQETGFPYEQASHITVNRTGSYTVAIRRPSWVDDGFNVMVNGVAVRQNNMPQKDGEGCYVYVSRRWREGDRIDISLPMSLRTEECPNYPDYVAYKVGPLLLAARTTASNDAEARKTGLTYEQLPNEYADDSRMGHSPKVRATMKPLSTAPMAPADRNHLIDAVSPLVPARHLYTIQPRNTFESRWPRLTLQPFYTIHHSRYSCYWQVK